MVTRKLKISADVWIDILTNGREHHFRVSKNALPEDAECVGIDWERPPGNNPPTTLILNIASSVFQPGDPDELPSPILETIPKGQ